MPFFIIFILFSLLEIAVFGEAADSIGLFPAVVLVIAAAFAGSILIRYQGLRTALAMRETLDKGAMPPHEIFDGFCRFAAGILLIVPGFVTDAIALFLLIPPMRRAIEQAVRRHPNWADPVREADRNVRDTGEIIEGEYERLDEDRRN